MNGNEKRTIEALESIAKSLELLTHRPVEIPGQITRGQLDATIAAMVNDHHLADQAKLPFTILAVLVEEPAAEPAAAEPAELDGLPPVVERGECRFCSWPIIRRAGSNRWQHDGPGESIGPSSECAQPSPKGSTSRSKS